MSVPYDTERAETEMRWEVVYGPITWLHNEGCHRLTEPDGVVFICTCPDLNGQFIGYIPAPVRQTNGEEKR